MYRDYAQAYMDIMDNDPTTASYKQFVHLGTTINSGAYLVALRRTRVGDIKVEECINYDHFKEWLDEQNIEIVDK